jgi:hypothetical protein
MKRDLPAIFLIAALTVATALTYWVATWPEWLRTATGPLDEAACAAWRADAEAAERKRKGWFAVYEGFARLQGVCLPQDAERGRALIEGALTLRLNDRIVIDYVAALRATGDADRAQEWTVHSTQLAMRRKTLWDRLDGYRRRTAGFDGDELGYLMLQGDILGTRLRIERMLARAPILPDFEAEALERWFSRLTVEQWSEYHFLYYRALREGRLQPPPREKEVDYLLQAVNCRHAEAVRVLAFRFATEEGFRPDYPYIAGAVVALHRETGQETELLAAVLRQQNRTLDDFFRTNELGGYLSRRSRSCDPPALRS